MASAATAFLGGALCGAAGPAGAAGGHARGASGPCSGGGGAGRRGRWEGAAFQRGLAALTQYIEREGAGKAVPRGHVETVVVGGEEYRHKLGVWISNTRSRREKLTGPQRAALAALGIGWA
ncbi:helicase associated domain-containing protein [Actinomadura keratinilytica]